MRLRSAWLPLIAAACAAPQPAPTTTTPADLAAALEGVYSNAAQYGAAPDAWKRPPEIGDAPPWIDAQHARFTRAAAPKIGDDVVFLEWRASDAGGAVSRQRLWSFRTDNAGALRMDFYSFPPTLAAIDAALIETLSPDVLIAYGDDCALQVEGLSEGFSADIPDTCQIIAQSGRAMTLSARIRLDGDTLEYDEAGLRPDGDIVFRVPGSAPGTPYQFKRIAAD